MSVNLTTSHYAVLGLLGVQPWSAYELTQQFQRSLRFFWTRSEAHLYEAPKRLVRLGYATARKHRVQGRTRTVYEITPAGRAALQAWLDTAPAPPQMEVEGVLRVLFADQGSKAQTIAAIDATEAQARATYEAGLEQVREYLDDGGPLPGRRHISILTARFAADFFELLIRWCRLARDEVEAWPDTRDLGMPEPSRALLLEIIERASTTLASDDPP
jgi:PadR family transcriptional regulator, regulatory protein AphA